LLGGRAGHGLPREVRGRSARDGDAEVLVADRADRVSQLGWQRLRCGDRPRDPGLRSALGERRLAHSKPQALHGDAPLAKTAAHVLREHGELVSPDAVGHPEKERAVLQRDGLGTFGDAGAHGVAPQPGVERRVHPREAVLAGSAENRLQGFRLCQG
jgi:hypothetical protein